MICIDHHVEFYLNLKQNKILIDFRSKALGLRKVLAFPSYCVAVVMLHGCKTIIQC